MILLIARNRKILSIILCILIIFSSVLINTLQVNAYAPAMIYYGGAAVVAGALAAMGYSNLTPTDCDNVYNALSTGVKDFIDGLKAIPAGLGFAKMFLPSNLMSEIQDLTINGELPIQTSFNIDEFYKNPEHYHYFTDSISLVSADLQSDYYIIVLSNNTWHDAGLVQTNNINMYFTYRTWAGAKYLDLHIIDGYYTNTQYTQSGNIIDESMKPITKHTINTGSIYDTNINLSSIPIYDENGTLIGYPPGSAPTYIYNNYYSNYPVNSDGSTTIMLPATSNPITNTTIPLDTETIPINTQTVLDGQIAVDTYLDNGGAIVLEDGTVIGEGNTVNDWTTTNQNVKTATEATEIGLIETLITTIISTLTGIKTLVSDFVNVRTFDLDFTPLKNIQLHTKFPFCIPFDFIGMISEFAVSPSDYAFTIDLETSYFEIHHTVDLQPYYIAIQFFRLIVTATFIFILISKTRDLIKW